MDKSELLVAFTILLASYIVIDYLRYEERPTVVTENGIVRGIFGFSSDSYRKYKAFMGIPYASAPVGELRFESPQPAENWKEPKDASQYGPQCLSTDILFSGLVFGSEDCLFLNVFVPLKKKSDQAPFPVMVFFHGGYWHVGSSQDHGERRFMEKDVIFVSVNYRLGALGFLSTGDSNGIRGNMGLKDQVMALKWVQRNIEKFGGDPGQVTIFGESVGAASVHLHMLSPMSKDLFHRGISQSGTALNSFSTYRKVKSQSKRFAQMLGCPTDNIKSMMKCLKSIDAFDLVSLHKEALDLLRNRQAMFAPTIEPLNDTDAFLVEEPMKSLERGQFTKVPWITGVNAHEGRFTTAGLSVNEPKRKIVQNYKDGLPKLLHYVPNDETSMKIESFYFGNLPPNSSNEDYLVNLTNLISDRTFYYPLKESALFHAKYAPTYLYYYQYNFYLSLDYFFYDSQNYLIHPALNMLIQHTWRFVKEFILRIPVMSEHTCHGDELPLFFTHPWTPTIFSWLPSRDIEMSRHLVKLWTDFASSRSTLSIGKVRWEPLDPKNEILRFLYISKEPAMIDEPFSERMTFWKTIYSSLEEQ